MALMVVQVFFEAAILCGILYLIARHEADYSFSKVAMVTAGLMLGSVLIDAIITPKIGYWSVLVYLAFVAFMIVTFCWISWWKSLIVVVVYSGSHFAIALVVAMVLAHLGRESGKSGQAVMGATESEMKEIEDTIKDQAEIAYGQSASAAAPEPESAVADSPKPRNSESSRSAANKTGARAVAAPGVPAGAGEATGWEAARRSLRIGGMAGGGSGSKMAVINSQIHEAGDYISTESGGTMYRWRIDSIDTNGIRLVPVDSRPLNPETTP